MLIAADNTGSFQNTVHPDLKILTIVLNILLVYSPTKASWTQNRQNFIANKTKMNSSLSQLLKVKLNWRNFSCCSLFRDHNILLRPQFKKPTTLDQKSDRSS